MSTLYPESYICYFISTPKMNISEIIHIEKNVDEVYAYLMDFRLWSEWSPWLVCEPDAELKFKENSYIWEGEVVGAGKMTLIESDKNQRMVYDLEFFKPWKSHAGVQFDLSPSDSGMQLVWTMQSSLPWFMFWLKPMMIRIISMDYQRGLRMLKEKLETGKINSKLEFSDLKPIDGCHYIGIETTCSIDDVDTRIRANFTRLMELPLKNKLESDDENLVPFTIYHKWNIGKGIVSYICCIPIKEKLKNIAKLPYETVSGYRPPCDAFVATHTGSYQHLGNAWAAAMNRAQNKVIAQNKKISPFEIYITNPHEDEGDMITKVCIPLR